MFNDREVCGTCRFHEKDDEHDDWICTNPDSEHCSDWTGYEDSCWEWESRK